MSGIVEKRCREIIADELGIEAYRFVAGTDIGEFGPDGLDELFIQDRLEKEFNIELGENFLGLDLGSSVTFGQIVTAVTKIIAEDANVKRT